MTRELMEGSEAIAAGMVAAGCRFFAGYPMTPFTEVLEHMAKRLPAVGGTCMNAESELEAIGMTWGAAATGTRAATGSCGQGLSLMQESISEMSLARIPAVVVNMGRAQGDYFQATRGGGHGDYRTVVLAPADVPEAATLVQRAFHLADRWRNPVVFYGDYYLAHTKAAVEITPVPPAEPLPPKDWALDGRSGGSGRAKVVSPLGDVKQRDGVGYDMAEYYERCGQHLQEMIDGVDPMAETEFLDDAELVVTAWGTPARFVRYVVRQLRAEGHRVGFIRPITLFPFPSTVFAEVAERVRAIAVYENNRGQMLDDVRLAVLGRAPVEFIGRLSLDSSAFGIAPDLDVPVIRERIEGAARRCGLDLSAVTP